MTNWIDRAASSHAVDTVPLPSYTVATLPTPAEAGHFAFVTDALLPAAGSTVAGGGAVRVPVFFNGTLWIVW